MSFQWLQMRITEEKERQQRESRILERLPRALEEVRDGLAACIEEYSQAFGPESAELQSQSERLRVIVREVRNGKWEQRAKVEVNVVSTLPGFHIVRVGDPLDIVVGLLPGDKIFYRDADEYLTIEELTRRILDRALFPLLGE